MNVGQPAAAGTYANPMYINNANPGIMAPGIQSQETSVTLEQYENVFGPAARDIKFDNQRNKRHQRWHLPDALKGANQYLTDRVDGLITDATNSPFTRNILPYVYLENPDQKLKWNVYSFDEGMASRVPYESAARVLPQTKRSYAGYAVRQGLAIAMEHNFMVSEAGRLNFGRQLTQLVGSIQLTNDLDVHVALITAPSYQKIMDEKYMDSSRTFAQTCREYADTFGMMQKTANALDFIIEDAKNHLKTWGSQPPTFILCNGALTTQLTMIPEKTNYVTNGPDGARRLSQGPDLPSYRGLNFVNSRKFSMEAGSMPRDLLRRRVRVSQHYHIPWDPSNIGSLVEFYDEGKDSFFTMSWIELYKHSLAIVDPDSQMGDGDDHQFDGNFSYFHTKPTKLYTYSGDNCFCISDTQHISQIRGAMNALLKSYHTPPTQKKLIDAMTISELKRHLYEDGGGSNDDSRAQQAGEESGGSKGAPKSLREILEQADPHTMIIHETDLLVLRPNIEHEMLGVIRKMR